MCHLQINYVHKQKDKDRDRQIDRMTDAETDSQTEKQTLQLLLPFTHESVECPVEEHVLSPPPPREIYRVLQCLQVPKQMGILKMVESGNWLTTDKIVQRIIENR